MLLKTQKVAPLPEEGTYNAAINSFKGQPADDKPKKVLIGFKIDNYEPEVIKETSPSFEVSSPLRKDVETLLGRELTATEAEKGFDVQSLKGTRCQIVVFHKAHSGGRRSLAVAQVLRAEK